MVPPRLVRRIVLAPLLIVIAAAVVVLFLPLALLALAFGLARGSRPGHSRSAEPRSAQAPAQARASRLGRLRALRVRALIEATATEVMQRAGRALGAGPLCHDEAHGRRVADLTVYLRQHHSERDLAELGALVSGRSMPW